MTTATAPLRLASSTCNGATGQAQRPCSRSAAQVVTLVTSLSDPDPRVPSEVETQVRMCDFHADRLAVGKRTGRSTVVAKATL